MKNQKQHDNIKHDIMTAKSYLIKAQLSYIEMKDTRGSYRSPMMKVSEAALNIDTALGLLCSMEETTPEKLEKLGKNE